jgi:hypothetical protein
MNFSAGFVRNVGYLGAAANWLIPIAAFRNLPVQPVDQINPAMTMTLMGYSCIFWRWAIAISPANYPLMLCHTANFTAQGLTLFKYAASTPAPAEVKA